MRRTRICSVHCLCRVLHCVESIRWSRFSTGLDCRDRKGQCWRESHRVPVAVALCHYDVSLLPSLLDYPRRIQGVETCIKLSPDVRVCPLLSATGYQGVCRHISELWKKTSHGTLTRRQRAFWSKMVPRVDTSLSCKRKLGLLMVPLQDVSGHSVQKWFPGEISLPIFGQSGTAQKQSST